MNVEEINVLLDRVETVLRSQNKIEAEFLIKDLEAALPLVKNQEAINYINNYITSYIIRIYNNYNKNICPTYFSRRFMKNIIRISIN